VQKPSGFAVHRRAQGIVDALLPAGTGFLEIGENIAVDLE
jgi:hypothetical protein